MWTDPLTAFPLQQPAGGQALEHRHFFYGNKSELDAAIEKAGHYGWRLLRRSYSSEKGHGADLVRPPMCKAA